LARTRQRSGSLFPHSQSTPRERAELIRTASEARVALREAAVAAVEAAARARAVADELDQALAALKELEIGSPTMPPSWHDALRGVALLSPREREVLALVAEGRSNKVIAEALFVSPNTIKTHVASLLMKLHADSRVELAAIAARHRLR
jgi:DNA-binding NarL/FixJ family response regulator